MKNSVYRVDYGLTISHHIWLLAIIPVCQLGNAFSILFRIIIYTFCIEILCIINDDVSVYEKNI